MNYNKHMRLLSGRMMLAAFVMFLSQHARAQQGYAVYDSTTKTLTFKYGTPTGTLNTNYYNTDNTGTAYPGWYNKRSSITTVVFDSSFAFARPTSCYGWFRDFTNLKTIDVDNLNTSSVTNMTYMFSGCYSLISIKCSKDWNNNTVTRSEYMFSGCKNLRGAIFYDVTKVDVSYANPATGYFSLKQVGMGYAVFNSSTGTLTFKYGIPTGTLNTDYYNADNTGTSNPGWSSKNYSIRTVVFDPSFSSARPTSCYGWFRDFTNLKTIDLDNLNTSSVTNMAYMFRNCSGLQTIDVDNLNTSSVTNMSNMFNNCSNLISIKCSKDWNNNTVTISEYMFSGCSRLRGAIPTASGIDDVRGANPDTGYFSLGPGGMGYAMFDSRTGTLTFKYGIPTGTLNTDYYDVDNTSFGTTGINPKWENKKSSIKKVVFDSSFSYSRPSSCYCWFSNCTNLTEIIGIEYFNTSKVTDMYCMFACCSALTSLDVTHFDTSSVTRMFHMFLDCSGLTSLDASGFDTSKVTNMYGMFAGCSGLTSLDVSGFDTSNVVEMWNMFNDCSSLTSLDIRNFDTSKAIDMQGMFCRCSSLTSLDIDATRFDTSNVTSMSAMFWNCRNLTSLDVSGFNTSNVSDMDEMFGGCVALANLDVSGFNTSKVTSMSGMFQGCSKLTSLDVSGFNTSNVTSMYFMFSSCSSLTSLDVSGFDTSNVTNMMAMFQACSNLTSLDVTGFDTSNVTNMCSMFNSCSSLTSLTFGKKFSTDKVEVKDFDLMFSRCPKLRYIDFYASDDTDAITSANYATMFMNTPVTTVIYLPHGSKEVTNRQNVVYSYGGNQNDLRCPKYYSEDKVDIEFPRDFKTNEAVYKRAMSNSYGSVVLPYAFTTNSKIQAYTLNAEYTGMMYFKDAKTVAAHTPFAFKKQASGTEADFTMTDASGNFGITVKATRSTNAAEDTWTGTKGSPYTANTNLGGWTAKGYYVEDTVNDYSDAYYIANEKFYKADGALTMYPHRVTFHGAWTKGTGNAKFFDIETGDDEVITAIEAAETEQTLRDAAGIYDASGRRQTAVRKGLNIVRMSDGTVKKVIVK